MRTKLLTLLFILSAQISNAADAPQYLKRSQLTPIAETSLHLFGRGFSGKRSGQRLMVACVGENQKCDLLQFAYFRSPSEGYWVGPKFSVLLQEGKKHRVLDAEESFELAMKRYTKNEFSNNSDLGTLGYIALTIGGVAITGATGYIPPIIASGVLFVLGVGNVNNSTFWSSFDFFHPFQRGFNVSESKAFVEHAQWNWSILPVTIKEKHFQYLVEEIEDAYFSRMTRSYFVSEDHYLGL